MSYMETVQIRLPKQQIEKISSVVGKGQFPNRSELVRNAVRELLENYDVNGNIRKKK